MPKHALSDALLDSYLRRARAIPVLSREAEHELALLSRAGDQEATHRLVEANLRYVIAVALQYRRYGMRLGDLISEGNLGLVTAVRKFDPERGTRFVTYAGYWIRAFVLESVVRSKTLVGAGSGPFRSKLFFRLRRERAKLSNLITDETERNERMAEIFETTPEKMRTLLGRLDARDVSLDAPIFDAAGPSLVETLEQPGEGQDMIYDRAQRRRTLRGRLGSALGRLDQRERFIVERRLLDEDGMSLAALGRELGVSRERARQLEVRAKRKLREQLADLAPAA